MPFAIVLEEPADWEERYRLLFERHETFILKLCQTLKLEYEITGENEILHELEKYFLVPVGNSAIKTAIMNIAMAGGIPPKYLQDGKQ